MKILDAGHTYLLNNFEKGSQELRFIKRNSGSKTHNEEYDGVQSQEVIRALIDRTQYLNNILPCIESEEAIYHLRMALFLYEARAYRRKQDNVNRKAPSHDDTERPKPWREFDYNDVPFSEYEIETWEIGKDGHLIMK